MPNSYSVVPNVLPGNVTIGGNLTLLGDQLQLGTGTPKVRLWNSPNNALVLSYNLGFDNNTQDDAARDSCEYELFSSGQRLAARWKASAGVVQAGAFTLPVYTDYTRHTHTGTVTADTVLSKLIRGGIIGPNGGIRMHFAVQSTVQGAGSTVVNLLWGGITALMFSIAAAAVFAVDVYINNRNAANAQVLHWEVRNLTSGVVSGSTITAVQDTTADITVGVQVQNANVGDSQNFEMVVAQLINSFGPV